MSDIDISTPDGRLQFLQSVRFFQERCFDNRILVDLANNSNPCNFGKGERVIFRETIADRCYVVVEGELEVDLPHAAKIMKGQIVGHVGALSYRGWKRACDVVSVVQVIVLEISFDLLRKHAAHIWSVFYEAALAYDREGVDLTRQFSRQVLPSSRSHETYGPGNGTGC